jgi:hypothetical protein
MAARFLYTRDDLAQDPKLAKQTLLAVGKASLTDCKCYDPASNTCRLERDAALLAMGDTDELKTAFQNAKSAGVRGFEVAGGGDLAIWYVRDKTKDPDSILGFSHTVTIISVASDKYWGGEDNAAVPVNVRHPWRNAQTGAAMFQTGRSTFRTLDDFLNDYIPNRHGEKESV